MVPGWLGLMHEALPIMPLLLIGHRCVWPGSVKDRAGSLSAVEHAKAATKSRLCTKGEHPLLITKRIFGFTHIRYRGQM